MPSKSCPRCGEYGGKLFVVQDRGWKLVCINCGYRKEITREEVEFKASGARQRRLPKNGY
jgi:uncharacterized Zn finger protein (UPF0148 family)